MPGPFDAEDARYRVLVNGEQQHSLWPDGVDVPAGWSAVYGPAGRAACLRHVERSWSDLRPASLRRATPEPSSARAGCVHDAFERCAASAPDAIALVAADGAVTYGELSAAADRLAAGVAAATTRAEAVVGICLERGVDLVVALLGVLKAGCAYVCLDPTFPAARREEILLAARAEALIARAWRPSAAARELAAIDPRPQAHTPGLAPPAARAVPDSLACVLFTSGSTGTPKGVAVPHRAIVGTLVGQDYAEFDSRSVWLQSAPISWDAFHPELLGALLHGGTCVMQPGEAPDPALMAALAARHGVTVLKASASLFNHMVDEHPQLFRQVRQAITGGEAPSIRHLAELRRLAPGLRLTNGYGPVESMGFTTAHDVTDDDLACGVVPIGRAVAGKRIHVLGEDLRPVAPGEVGEIHAAGVGLARGYLGSPALTAERFVASPFGPPGERMYRTGDLARVRPDGAVEYLRRSDDQLKIRGFRVEPAEVERVLAGHDDVRQVAVAVRDDGPAGSVLVAYVVAAGRGGPDLDELRRFARSRLPAHLAPAVFVALAQLPRTAAGKLDRRALPRPDYASGNGDAATPDEAVLCALFAEVLGVADVGTDADFFALGGESLLALRLIGRIRSELDVEIGAHDLFERPSAAGLARRVRSRASARPPLHARERPQRVPLSAAQLRLWFLSQLEDGGASYNCLYLLHLRGRLSEVALADALADVVARHETLRTTFPVERGEPWQRVLPPEAARPALVRVDCSASGLAAELRAASRHAFDLERDLPIRARLHRIAPDHHALLLVLHHIATDAWSRQPLLRDLGRAYTARAAGRAPAWEPLPVQYADYALWHAELLGADGDPASVVRVQGEHWARALAGLPRELALPRDRPRSSAASHGAVGRVELDVPAATHLRVVELARASRATAFMVLQAAVAGLLSRTGAGDDIALGTPIAGRTEPALDQLVGFFVNTLVLRMEVSGDPSLRELVRRAREVDVAAYAHQDVPFDRLVRRLNPDRALSRHPLFQVMLVMEDGDVAAPRLGDLDVALELSPAVPAGAKFDLAFGFHACSGKDGAHGIRASLEYDRDVFDASTAERLLRELERLLAAGARDPDLPLGKLGRG